MKEFLKKILNGIFPGVPTKTAGWISLAFLIVLIAGIVALCIWAKKTGKKEVEDVKNKKFIEQIENIIKNNQYIKNSIIEELLNKNYNLEQVSNALLTIILSNNGNSNEKQNLNITPDENGNVRLFLNIGKKDKIMVKDIVGCFTSNTAISSKNIGKINILENFSFVDIPADFVDETMKKIKGKTTNKYRIESKKISKTANR